MTNTKNPYKSKKKYLLNKISLLLFIISWTISYWAQNFIACSGTMSAEKGVSADSIHWCEATKNLYQSDYVYMGYSKASLGLIGEYLISRFFAVLGLIFFLIFFFTLLYRDNKNTEKSSQEETSV